MIGPQRIPHKKTVFTDALWYSGGTQGEEQVTRESASIGHEYRGDWLQYRKSTWPQPSLDTPSQDKGRNQTNSSIFAAGANSPRPRILGQHYKPPVGGLKVKALVTQSYPTLCDPMDCSPPGSSVHGILQARILEWVAISLSRDSSQVRDRTRFSCNAGRLFTH